MLKYGVFKHALTDTFQQFSCRPPTDNNYSSTLQRQHVVRHYQHPALRVRQLPKGLHVPERRQELQLHQEVRLKTISDGVFHNVNSQRSHHHLATVISFEGPSADMSQLRSQPRDSGKTPALPRLTRSPTTTPSIMSAGNAQKVRERRA